MKTGFVFQFWPYAATALFGAGMLVRWVTSRKASATFNARDLVRSTRSLLLGLFLLLLGHVAGLFFPRQILLWNGSPFRLYALEALGFAIGLWAVAGWAVVMWRHVASSDGSIGVQIGRVLFLSLLFTTLLSGSLTAVLLRWGSEWGAATLAPYTLSLLRGQPAVALAIGMPFLVRLHVFSAFATLALFPATDAASALVAALSRGGRWISTPAYRLFDLGRKPVRIAARRLNPAIWIWPELE